MKRLAILVFVLIACDKKSDDRHRPPACIDYATALLSQCHTSVRNSEHSDLQCPPELLEVGYNACNISLEAGQSVRMPGTWPEGMMYVLPPAPANWRGVDASSARGEP